MSSKKVFLATVYEGDNFGSSLQAFALKKYIELNHCVDCEIVSIRRKHLNAFLYNFYKKCAILLKMCIHPSQFKKTFSDYFNKNTTPTYDENTINNFRDFNSTFLDVNYYSYYSLRRESRKNDCVLCLCGSDQIWSPIPLFISGFNFLAFAPKIKRYSYACSFGTNIIPLYNKKTINRYLHQMQSISVREKYCVDFLNDYGLDYVVSLDPTLLVGKKFWDNYLDSEKNSTPYYLLYFLDKPPEEIISKINSYFLNKKRKVLLISRNKIHFSFECEQCYDLNPFVFLKLLKGADAVFTDSYHGTILSTLFHVRFITFQRDYCGSPSQSSRIQSFLNNAGLSNNFFLNIEKDIDSFLNNTEFNNSDLYIEAERTKSVKYLKDIFYDK